MVFINSSNLCVCVCATAKTKQNQKKQQSSQRQIVKRNKNIYLEYTHFINMHLNFINRKYGIFFPKQTNITATTNSLKASFAQT